MAGVDTGVDDVARGVGATVDVVEGGREIEEAGGMEEEVGGRVGVELEVEGGWFAGGEYVVSSDLMAGEEEMKVRGRFRGTAPFLYVG